MTSERATPDDNVEAGERARVEIGDEVAEQIARAFHAAYEELAPEHGYETREESRKLWADVPERNRALMIGTVKRLAATGVIAPAPPEPAPQARAADELADAVEQTKFDAEGNCFQACLATVLGCAIQDVPAHPAGEPQEDYSRQKLAPWLAARGLVELTMPVLKFDPDGWFPPTPWIAHVTTPFSSEWTHAVVCRGSKIVWNPDPRGGPSDLSGVEAATWLLAADPQAIARQALTRYHQGDTE